jgi:hypothetical protein
MACSARAGRIFQTLLGLVFTACIAGAASAQEQDKGTSVRPELGKPVQQAADLIKAKKGREALAKLREAQEVRDKTVYEAYLVERVFGLASASVGDAATAARSFEKVVASPAVPEGERRQFIAAAASQYYAAKEYPKAAELASRYLRDGGPDRAIRTVHVQALYLSNNFAAAAKALSADIEADEQANKAPTEEQLQLLSNAYLQQRDAAGNARALEKLLSYYPKRDYWINALYGLATIPGVSEKLALDVARLKLSTGTLRTAAEYFDAVQLALHAGFPMEALKIIEQGYAAGLLGTGADAERHKRLRTLVDKDLAEDRKLLAQEEAKASSTRDGKTLLNDGFNYVLHGKAAKGVEMMEQGLRLGSGLKRPDHAKLQLAHGYHLAGQNQKAIQAYRTVQGTDGTAALAHLWIIHLRAL